MGQQVLLISEGRSPVTGRYFDRSTLAQVVAECKDPIPLVTEFSEHPSANLHSCIGVVENLVLKEDGLYGDLTFTAPYLDLICESKEKVKPKVAFGCTGKIQNFWVENQVVDVTPVEFKLVGWQDV